MATACRPAGGERIGLPARLVQLAGPVEVFTRRHGLPAAVAMARRHRGTQFDPGLVTVFADHAAEVVDGLDQAASWDAVLEVEPQPSRRVGGTDLDSVLEAMADLADLKSPHLAGHSRGVANLVDEAARVSGGSAEERTTVRRAGLVHDLGRVGVSTAIWDKPSRLSDTERERVRLHPYLTDRMLARVTALDDARTIAARHHERLDGSGYPRGLTAASLTPSDRLLAAADVYHAMTEPRPYRPALDGASAARQLRAEVRDGRLDGDAADAVLRAAGHRAPARRSWPAGLTTREVEVLGLVARGRTNRQIAQHLVVSPKTVSNHVEHVYTKIGVSAVRRPRCTPCSRASSGRTSPAACPGNWSALRRWGEALMTTHPVRQTLDPSDGATGGNRTWRPEWTGTSSRAVLLTRSTRCSCCPADGARRCSTKSSWPNRRWREYGSSR